MLCEFRGRKETGLAYLSAARGLGFLGGPISGQILYSLLDYLWTFLGFAILLVAAMIFTIIMLPSRLNEDTQKSKAAQRKTARLS